MAVARSPGVLGARRMLVLGVVLALAGLVHAPVALAASKTSVNVGYVFDFGSGANDNSGQYNTNGSGIFHNALTGSGPGSSYTTADGTKTVSLTDVPVSSIDGGASLAPYDTLILYQVCDIGNHPTTMAAINAFLLGGGKVLLYDADRCVSGMPGYDYSTFLFPFTTNSPGPVGSTCCGYVTVVPSPLTTGLSAGSQGGGSDALGDANIFTSPSGPWCTSITANNSNGADGIVQATAQTPSGGLVIYEGEDNWDTWFPTAHLHQVFDLMLEQNWAPAHLPCTIPASGIAIAPPSQTQMQGGTATLTATVTDVDGNSKSGVAVAFGVTGANAGAAGTESNGGVTDSNGQVTFTYTGVNQGTDQVTASFVDSQGATHTSTQAVVNWTDADITGAQGEDLSGTEGASAGGTVATFTDPDTHAGAGEYSASIDWGDGHTSTGTVTGSGGSFSVSGSNSYGEEGSYPIKVAITDTDNSSNTATTSSAAHIGDAALTASGITPEPVSPQSFSGPVATFTDANAGSAAVDFTATVDWGDGSPVSPGTVTSSGGIYTVSGGHTYDGTGPFTIKTHIVDDGGSTADATTTVLVFGTSVGGNFVIGDENAANGTAVTFWGAKWWKANSLSGGSAPASFKGFADSPDAAPVCGTTWTTDPGDSSEPPSGQLPAFMAVIVADQISQTGSTISGDTPRVVVVKTDPGYAPDPGHAGTGTVVGEVCHM